MDNPETSDPQSSTVTMVWNPNEIPDSTRNIIKRGLWTQLPPVVTDKIEQVAAIDTEAFGSRYGFSLSQVQSYFLNPKSEIILLSDETDPSKIIGYTIAIPVDQAYLKDESYKNRQVRPNTAYVISTAFRKEYRGKGLVIKLRQQLETELKKKGYTHIEQDNIIEGGYADKIRKNYHDQIEESHEADSPLGRQMFFRIRL